MPCLHRTKNDQCDRLIHDLTLRDSPHAINHWIDKNEFEIGLPTLRSTLERRPTLERGRLRGIPPRQTEPALSSPPHVPDRGTLLHSNNNLVREPQLTWPVGRGH